MQGTLDEIREAARCGDTEARRFLTNIKAVW